MSVTALSLCCVGLATHGLAIEVEHVEDLVFRGLLVDAYVADAGQQGEVDVAVLVLLVVGHEFKKAFILFAVEYVHAVVLFDELDGLKHGVVRKTEPFATEVKLANESPSHCISVQYGLVPQQGEALYGVARRVAEVEGLLEDK